MNKRKIMKIVFIILAVMLGLVLLEVGIRALCVKVPEYIEKKKEEKELEEFYNSEPEQAKKSAAEFVETIYDAIENKDYNYIYESLDDIYAEYMFSGEMENLKAYLKDFKLGTNHTVNKVSKTAGVYHVLVGIESGEEYTSRYFSVKENVGTGERKYTFMFDEYLFIKKQRAKYIESDVEYNLKYLLESPDFLVYVLDVTNKTSQKKTIDFKDMTLTSTAGKIINGNVVESISFEADEKTHRVHMVFPKKTSSISFMQFKAVVDGEEKDVKIFFENGIS